MTAATPAQRAYLFKLRVRWSLSDAALDAWCAKRFRCGVASLTKDQASALIDDLTGWTTLPDVLRREMGQPVLPGFAPLLRDDTR